MGWRLKQSRPAGAVPAYISAAPSPPPPVGNALLLNLNGLSNFDPQQPFLNVFKSADSNFGWHNWSTHTGAGAETNEEQYLAPILDSDGYPTSLTVAGIPGGQVFTTLFTSMLIAQTTPTGATSAFPTGTYRMQFTGSFTLVFSADVQSGSLASPTAGVTVSGLTVTSTLTGSTVGTVTFNVPSASAGIKFILTALPDAVNYFKNVTIVQNSLASLLDAGQVFHPNFLAFLQSAPIAVLRFMDALNTNGQTLGGSGNHNVASSHFTANPQSGDVAGTLTAAWNLLGGTWLITLVNGDAFNATFTAGSTAVAFNGTVSSNCSAAYFYACANGIWSQRPQLSNAVYTTGKGAPIELCTALCNAVSSACWLCIPNQASASYWSSLATAVKASLNSSLKAYIEWGNENWNSGAAFATGFSYMVDMGTVAFGTNAFGAAFKGKTTALIADSFATVYGTPGFDSRVVVSMGGQAASTSHLTLALASAPWVAQGNTAPWLRTSASGQKTIKAVHIAPYFGLGAIPSADYTYLTAQGDGGYAEFFSSLQQNPSAGGHTFTSDGSTSLPVGGWFGLGAGWVVSNVSAMTSFGNLPVLCYEGGWQFDALGANAGQASFQFAAARDARMATLSQVYYRNMAANGTTLPAQFNFASTYANGFMWGALESVMQPASPLASSPPRWQGLINFVNNG